MSPLRAWLIGILAAGWVAAAAAQDAQDAQDVKAITGATVIRTGSAPLPDAVVILEGARIVRVGPAAATPVPAKATIIDARGKFVMPGLADMHNHVQSGSFRQQQNVGANLSVLLASGVTTVFNPSVSLTDFSAFKRATAADTSSAPRFFGTGPVVTVKGDALGAAVGSPTPDTVPAARATVTMLKAAGVDAIKVNVDDVSWAARSPVSIIKPDVLTALVDEAHRQGLKVYAHAPLLEPARDALRAGADGLLHGIIDKPIDQEFIRLMARNRAVYVPTLVMFEDVADVSAWAARQAIQAEGSPLAPLAESFRAPEFAQRFTSFLDNTAFTKARLPTVRDNLKRLSDAGIPIVMGTDTGFFGVMMGTASQMELALMVDAGLTPEGALRAATINAARMLGREKEAGTVEAGRLADLLILDANPLDDVRNVRRVFRVIRGGTVYDPAQLLSTLRFTPAGRGRGN